MIVIAHRGNTRGPNPRVENEPGYVLDALLRGFDVEVDVWLEHGGIFLGHDGPQFRIGHSFLVDDHIWGHAKNLAALDFMLEARIRCFWHQNDDFTLTSDGYVWTFPGKPIIPERSILVVQDDNVPAGITCAGVCSDFAEKIRKRLR